MSPEQCKMARVALNLGIRDLADEAKVSTNTVTRFEGGDVGVRLRTVQDIRAALEARGVQFLADGDVSVGDGVALTPEYRPKPKGE